MIMAYQRKSANLYPRRDQHGGLAIRHHINRDDLVQANSPQVLGLTAKTRFAGRNRSLAWLEIGLLADNTQFYFGRTNVCLSGGLDDTVHFDCSINL